MPGLGNGGLGRLAACFLDRMAALELPGFGYGIRYEYGIFEQTIVDGRQVERADSWLREGNPWEIPRHELAVPVNFYGRVEQHHDDAGRSVSPLGGHQTVVGVPYDLPVAGYAQRHGEHAAALVGARVQRVQPEVFNAGDFRRAVEEKALSEAISRVLYPADHSAEGRELRLKQQYFFCACAIHDIVRRFLETHSDLRLLKLPDKAAIQLNDTHPSIAIASSCGCCSTASTWPGTWPGTSRSARSRTPTTRSCRRPSRSGPWPCSSGCCRGTSRSSTRSTTACCAACTCTRPRTTRSRRACR
jgi:starch phosphorylase